MKPEEYGCFPDFELSDFQPQIQDNQSSKPDFLVPNDPLFWFIKCLVTPQRVTSQFTEKIKGHTMSFFWFLGTRNGRHTKLAIEHGPVEMVDDYPLIEWWVSIVLFVYQRVGSFFLMKHIPSCQTKSSARAVSSSLPTPASYPCTCAGCTRTAFPFILGWCGVGPIIGSMVFLTHSLNRGIPYITEDFQMFDHLRFRHPGHNSQTVWGWKGQEELISWSAHVSWM